MPENDWESNFFNPYTAAPPPAPAGMMGPAPAPPAPAPVAVPPPPPPAPAAPQLAVQTAGDTGTTGMMGPAPTPAPTPAPAATPAPASASTPAPAPATSSPAPAPAGDPSVIDWYRNVVGRDATAQEVAFHQNNVATLGADTAFNEFLKGLSANGENAKTTNYAQANAAYQGYQSQNGGSMVDDWARNVFGRPATAQELAAFGSATTPQQAEANYAAFLAQAKAAGQVGKTLSMEQASLLTPMKDSPYPYAYGEQGMGRFTPDTNRQVDFRTMTIEGRIGNLLAQDAQGNYTNEVVRQAVDRATQSFAARGLLNSSMAAQAGQEAAIAKAIEIAGPDAQTYFAQSRANQDANNVFSRDEIQQNYKERNDLAQWAHEDATQKADQQFRDNILTKEQSFTLRQNYIEAQDHANDRYTQQVNQINASNMTPEDKNVAIAQAQAVRDGDLTYNNNLFAAQPGFVRDWLSAVVGTSGIDVEAISNRDTLANIINDPAQPPSLRERARARLEALGGTSAPAPAATPAPTPAPNNSGWIDYTGAGAA